MTNYFDNVELIKNEDGSLVMGEKGFKYKEKDTGEEKEWDAVSAAHRLMEVNEEAEQYRKQYKELKRQLETLQKNEEAPKQKEEAIRYKTLAENQTKEIQALTSKINELAQTNFYTSLKSAFNASPLFSGDKAETKLPPEIAFNHYKEHFKQEVDDFGRTVIVAYGRDGQPIRTSTGEKPTDLAEAIKLLVDKDPNAAKIKHSYNSGGGIQPTSANNNDIYAGTYEEYLRRKKNR